MDFCALPAGLALHFLALALALTLVQALPLVRLALFHCFSLLVLVRVGWFGHSLGEACDGADRTLLNDFHYAAFQWLPPLPPLQLTCYLFKKTVSLS